MRVLLDGVTVAMRVMAAALPVIFPHGLSGKAAWAVPEVAPRC